jgi:hypothetical protein
MITCLDFSKINIEIIPSYTDIIKKLNEVENNYKLEYKVHWIPLCIHSKVNIKNY